tara:strand:+ start:1965 stop:2591 length:627 start_codon:yes stop_codon:yes gene_type:complete
MTDMIKHTGRIDSTNRRVIVVFPQIPEDQENCLVVDVDSLPEKYHDGLMKIVESAESQESNQLYEVLGRNLFWDGKNCLSTLHEQGFLRRVPVNTVTLLPRPDQSLPLKDFNAYQSMVAETKTTPAEPTDAQTTRAGDITNPADETDSEGIARNLLVQAELLENEARQKRAEAEQVSPGIQVKLGKVTTVVTKRGRGRPKKAEATTTA